MANFPPGTTIHIDLWNQYVMRSGLGNTDAPDQNEARMFLENGAYTLKIYDGAQWQPLNAGTLDGNNGSFYRNANNLNTGKVPLARLDIAHDEYNNTSDNIYILYGAATVPTGTGNHTITYSQAFSLAPSIAILADNSSTPKYSAITTTSFSMVKHPTVSYTFTWIAIGKK